MSNGARFARYDHATRVHASSVSTSIGVYRLRMLATRPRSVSCQPPLIAIESTRPATQKSRTSSVQGTARKRRARACRWIVMVRPSMNTAAMRTQ